MNEWIFNDTPAQSLHWLLGVKNNRFIKILNRNNILKMYKAISVKSCTI